MRRRDSSGPGAGGRKRPAGRSGARSNPSRVTKPSPRSRSDRDDSNPKRPSKFSHERGESPKDFSKSPRGGKSFGRKNKPPGFSSRSEKPVGRTTGSFTPTRDDRGDTRPAGQSKFSRRKNDSKEFSKPRERKFDHRAKERPEGFSKPREGKSFDRSDKPSDKKGFFSKLSRGGKSFERSKRHDADFGESLKDYSKHKEEEKEVTQQGSDKIRLNKYISNSGVCSRREADELITMGLVSVNGTVITELGYKVNRNDVVKYDGKTLRAEKPVYILLNKPKGFLTTTKDPQERNTVMQIIAGAVKERVYPVGRLDRNTTGLLLLTNDGELTDKLSHPSYNVKKIYKAELDKPLTKADVQKIQEGVRLEEGRAMVDDLAIVSDDGKTVGIEIHIGWNRVIRRIFESLGYQVVKLDRSVYAGLDKKDLGRGHWRFLTNEEVVRLKHYK